MFEQLFGWDQESNKSKKDGGILGHLHAFYGTAEYTKCGQLHGHFLIWLDGSLNPSDVHKRMKKDSDWRDHFLAFFEDIIHHQLPDVPFDFIPDWNQCSEQPPNPDDTDFTYEFSMKFKPLLNHLPHTQSHTLSL